MRFKDTIKLAKKALKQPWLYTEGELLYLKRAKKLAQKALKIKHMNGKNDESNS
jgi:hypothetical protein